jgi:hypothetical protein
MGVSKTNAFRRQFVNVRRPDPGIRIITTHISVPQIIGHDKDYVWFCRCAVFMLSHTAIAPTNAQRQRAPTRCFNKTTPAYFYHLIYALSTVDELLY